MKKIMKFAPLVLIAVLAVAMTACGGGRKPITDVTDVQAFIDAVNLLPNNVNDVKVTDETAVDAAIGMYNALSQEDKLETDVVIKYTHLGLLKAKILALKEDGGPPPGLSATQQAFIAAVALLATAAEVTTLAQAEAQELLIPAAETAFAAISAAEVNHSDVVTAKQKLDGLKTKINQIKTAGEQDAKDSQAATDFIALVAKLPAANTITDDNKAPVITDAAAARAFYDDTTKMTSAAKSKPGVSGALDTLTAVEAKLRSLEPRPTVPDIGNTVDVTTAAQLVSEAASGNKTIVIKNNMTLTSAIAIGAGRSVMIRADQGANVTLTIDGGGRLTISGDAKLTLVDLKIVLAAGSSFSGEGGGAYTNMAIGIWGGTASAEFKLYYCEVSGSTSGSNGLLRIGGTSQDGAYGGTMWIFASTVTSTNSHRAIYGRTAQTQGGLIYIVDSTVTGILYGGRYNIHNSTYSSADFTNNPGGGIETESPDSIPYI